jgi:hypothetical protein
MQSVTFGELFYAQYPNGQYGLHIVSSTGNKPNLLSLNTPAKDKVENSPYPVINQGEAFFAEDVAYRVSVCEGIALSFDPVV